MRAAILAAAMLCSVATAAAAHDRGQWSDEPADVRAWYENAQVTEAAQPRLGFIPCCNTSEVVKTRFRVAQGKHGEDEWYYLERGAWKRVPPDIIHWGEHAPDGQPTLFVITDSTADTWHLPHGTPSCFYPGVSGQ